MPIILIQTIDWHFIVIDNINLYVLFLIILFIIFEMQI
jgi:hypothetical protein